MVPQKVYVYLMVALIALLGMVACAQEASDQVNGNLIQFNDNGVWCWYQDERAVVDVLEHKLIIGSDASAYGAGTWSRNGNIEVVIYDLLTGSKQRFVLMNAPSGCDDHNAPAFLIRPDGQYLAMYCQHYDSYSRYRIYNGTDWSNERRFNWNSIPGGTDFSTTYSNLFYLSAEQMVYNFVRCYARSPNMMVSPDFGDTWSYGGLLTEPDTSIGYVNGYFKYTSNGEDRIDFVATEHHPRDYNTSIYHGYIQNGRSFNAAGVMLDSDITDKSAPRPADYTLLFAADTVVNGDRMTRAWTIDLQAYEDGTLATIFKTRVNDSYYASNNPDHVFFYARFDGSQWTSTYLGKAGKKLYSSEQDYTGLGALHPHDPNTIYISTPFDPNDDTDLGVHEIFKGVTEDQGATWTWTAITRNSVRDNLRPIVPAWNPNSTALLWCRGTYFTAQRFDAAVVGIIERSAETVGLKHFVDANSANTFQLSGLGYAPWYEFSNVGNGGFVLASDNISLNAPIIKTEVKVPEAGTYDVWVNFWGNPQENWRIKAGLSEADMQMFRQMACQQVNDGDHDTLLLLAGSYNTFLYQAYVGRVYITDNETCAVFVDDTAPVAGGLLPAGDKAQTFYDGISYARVDPVPCDSPDCDTEVQDSDN